MPGATVVGQPNAAPLMSWSTVEDKKEGFSIDLPADWNVMNLDQESIAGLLESLKKKHPESAEWYSSQLPALVAQGMKLMAVEVTPSSLQRRYSASVNLIIQDMPVAVSSSYLAQASEAVVSKMIGGKALPPPTNYHCAKFDGALIEIDQETPISDGSVVKIHVRQLYVARGTRAFVLSFSSPLGEDAAYVPIFNRIANSLAMLDISAESAPANWQRYSISASGVSMELPQPPGPIEVIGKLIPQGGLPFIGRFFRFSGNDAGITFGILEGAYASGEAKEIARLFLKVMASVLIEADPAKPATEIPSEKVATDVSSETVVDGLPALQWENVSGEKDAQIHTRAVVVAENKFVYFIWLSYGEGDEASSEKASRMLGSINIERVLKENGAASKQPSLQKSGPELLAKEWKRYAVGMSGISLKLPAFPDKLDNIPTELSGISVDLQGESYAYHGYSIIFDVHYLKAKPKSGIFQDLLSGAIYARRFMLERMGFGSQSITTKAISGDTIEMTATKNGEPAVVAKTLLIQRKENLWVVGAQYRADDEGAAKAAERALGSVQIPKDGNY
jgi:hypothetical protein